jgi:hypothetical protein
MKQFLLVAVALGLIGCASEQVVYTKPGASQSELQTVVAKCKMALAQTPMPYLQPSSGGLAGLGQSIDNYNAQADYFKNCMIASGWLPQQSVSLVPHSENPGMAVSSAGGDFQSEVQEALKTCQGADDKDQAVEWAHCWGRVQRPLWAKWKPSYLDLLDECSASVVSLATQFQNGQISHEEYVSRLKEAWAAWKAKAEVRR